MLLMYLRVTAYLNHFLARGIDSLERTVDFSVNYLCDKSFSPIVNASAISNRMLPIKISLPASI